jgi:hypothetical protein
MRSRRGGYFPGNDTAFPGLSSDSIRPGPTLTSEPNFHITSRDPTPSDLRPHTGEWQNASRAQLVARCAAYRWRQHPRTRPNVHVVRSLCEKSGIRYSEIQIGSVLGAAASSSSQHAVTKPSLPAAEACFDAGAGRISQLLCIYNLLSIDLNGGRA